MSARAKAAKQRDAHDTHPAPVRRGGCGCHHASASPCAACAARHVQRAAEPGAASASLASAIPAAVHDVLSAPGQPLTAAERAHYEPRFGHDFGHVRLHTDSRAGESARAMRANAYTVGDHIVFGAGRYESGERGRRLLGHELAHTVQQHGLQREHADGVLPDSATEARFERDADAAASWAERAGTRIPVIERAAQPLLLRQPNTAPPPAAPAQPVRDWIDLDPADPLRAQNVVAKQQGPGGIVAFRVTEFTLPRTKGPVLALWEARANAQALEATIDFPGPGNPPRTALWQSRDRTSELRSSWIAKLGWTSANVAANWQTCGGDATPAGAEWRPRVAHQTCQMDHVVELQLGGTNTRENVQVLGAADNTASGRDIWQMVSGLAAAARNSLPDPKPRYILLHFDRVVQPDAPPAETCPAAGQPAASCTQAEACAITNRVALTPGADASGAALEAYPIRAAGASDTLRVLPAPQPTDLGGDENRAPRQIVPGVLLNTLQRPATGTADAIAAVFDTTNIIGNREATRIPMPVLGTPPPLTFDVDRGSGELRLRRPATAGVDFLFPYMSPVHLDLRYDPAAGWSGRGRLTPSLPLLSRVPLQVELSQGTLRAFVAASPSQLRSPIPGLRFTRAELGAQLIPAFDPRGVLGFEIGPSGRPIVTGEINVTADANGLVLTGPFTVNIPNVDPVQGEVNYRNGELTGSVQISSERIRFPGVQRGSLRVDFSNAGVGVTGDVDLLIAGTPVNLHAEARGGTFRFTGSATIDVPGGALEPVTLTVTTDGRTVSGEGRTAIRVRGLTGPVVIRYQDGRWSGSATLPFRFGRANGRVTATLNPSGAITGRGEITYPISDRITATVAVLLREDRTVRVDGDLVFAPIRLFDRFPRSGGRRTLFTLAPPSIPLYAIPLGPIGNVGITAQVRFTVGIDYGVGPGEIRNLRAHAAFDLFADDPNFTFHGGGQVYVPFNAGFFVGVDGALALEAPGVSGSGGVGLTADVGLRGQIQLDADIDYTASVLALTARLEASGSPRVAFGIDAFVRATALGVDVYEQRWRLANFEWGSDLRFGFAFPFEYRTDRAFEPPSLESIEWIYPRDVDASGLLRRLIA